MFPFPTLPGIPDWIKDQLSDLGDFVNPFIWFATAIKGVYNLLAWYYQFIIAHPPRFNDAKVEEYLYGNAIGVAGGIIGVVTFVLMCWAIFHVKKFITLGYAIVIGLVVTAGVPIVYGLFDTMIQLGDKLAEMAMFTEPKSDKDSLLGFAIDAVINPLLLIGALLPTTILGLISMLVVFMYEGLTIFIKIVFLPALALRLFGDRFRAFSDWTFSAGIIAMVLGRPVMILCIEIGKWAGNNLLGGSTASLVFFLNAMLVVGLGLQVVMFKQVQKVVAKVSGNTVSRVFGKLETTQKSPSTANKAVAFEQYSKSFKPADSHSSSKSSNGIVRQSRHYVTKETKKFVTQSIAKKATVASAAAATGGTSVAAGAAVAATATALSQANRRKDGE